MRTLPFARPDALEPPPAYAELRRTAPVARVTTPEGQPAWLVTSYDHAAAVLADPRFGVNPSGGAYPGNDTLFQDGDTHTRLRRLVSAVFTARRVASMRPRIEELATGYVEAVIAAGPPADLVADLAAPLSIAVIGELLGVPLDERGQLRQWAETALLADPAAALDPDAMAQAWQGLSTYAIGLVEAKRADLGDDLLSGLIAVRDSEDGRLSDDELVGMVTTLVSAGYLSSCNAISIGVIELITAGLLPDLAAEPDQIDVTVEELLRRLSGITGEALPRWAHADVELAGVRIAAGDQVLVRLEAANRDPDQFADPDQLDPDRKPNPHLAFGRGPHHCLGAALARVELSAAVRALARQLPGLRLDRPVEDIPWAHGFVDIGPAELPVRW